MNPEQEFKNLSPSERRKFISKHLRTVEEVIAFVRRDVESLIKPEARESAIKHLESLSRMARIAALMANWDTRFNVAQSKIVEVQRWLEGRLNNGQGGPEISLAE